MRWEDRLLGEDDLRRYGPPGAGSSFREGVELLIAQQLATWPMLKEGTDGLSRAEYRRFTVKGSEVLAQFNPGRIVSTAAVVDEATIKRRRCFLCVENLPSEERAIAFGDDLVVLCNPFPVLKHHLVIASKRHIPQSIDGNLGSLLDLTEELGEGWFALYNGPRCGASAPDHLHFQACADDLPPIFREIDAWKRRAVTSAGGIEAFTLVDYRVNLLAARSAVRDEMIAWFDHSIKELARKTEAAEEPMINVVVRRRRQAWTAIIFPRSKHRPSSYFAEGDAKLTVSPAAIDLSGALVVPQPDHFNRITGADIEKIFAEVTLGIQSPEK